MPGWVLHDQLNSIDPGGAQTGLGARRGRYELGLNSIKEVVVLIHRIRVFRVLPNLSGEQVFAFRMAGTQEEAESFGHRLQTAWMEQNPGHATAMFTDWPNSSELGGDHVMPGRPELVTFDGR